MSLQKSLGWMAMAQSFSILLQFGASVVLARLLSPHEFGVFAVAMSVSAVLSLIQALGLQALIVREENLTEAVSATAFTVNAVLALLLCGLIVLTSTVGGALLREDGVRQVLLALSVTPLMGAIAFLPAAHLERRGRFKELALAGVISGAVGALTTVALAASGESFMSFAYGQWAQGAIFALLICAFGRAFVSFKLGVTAWRRVAEFGFQMLAVSGVNAISGRLSDLILGRVLGLSALGLYNRATNLNGLVWTNIHLVLGRVLLVDFADIVRSGVSLRDKYIRTVDIVTAGLWPAFLGLAVVARPFIAALYGEAWVGAATPLALLAMASFIQVAITMTWELFTATGNLRAQTRIEIIRVCLSLPIFTAACFISLQAAAAARVIDALVAYAIYRSHVNRMTNTKTGDFLPIYLRNAGLAVLAVSPAAVTMLVYRFSSATPLPVLAAAIAVGIVLWGAALAAMKHPLMEEAMTIVASLRKRSVA